jgi:hypothetical protein
MIKQCPYCSRSDFPSDVAFSSHVRRHRQAGDQSSLPDPDKPAKFNQPEPERPAPISQAPSIPAEKATFSVEQKDIKLEKIPELEQETGPTATTKTGEAAKPASDDKKPLPQLDAQALRPTLDMMAARWNQFIEAPQTGNPADRYKWFPQDTENLLNAITGLDAKYHFMGNWLNYAPELFALIVIGGIVAKLVIGSQWKQKQTQAQPAAPTIPVEKPPTVVDRIKTAVSNIGKPQGSSGETMPADLAAAATEYINQQQKPAA